MQKVSRSGSTRATPSPWRSPANLLADEKSHYQRIRIFDTVANGRVMTLDDIVQITSRDESAYADMLTHLPMLEHGKVERVMIVGGGDLSIADEALKHQSVKEVVLVDIDGRVIELCKKHFGEINAKAFKDKRLNDRNRRRVRISGPQASKSRFDLIIADRPDPVGPGKALFGETFYDRVKGGSEARRLCHLPDRRAVLSALGDHRGAEGARGILPAIGSLSDRGADLYRRLHGALLGGQGRQAAGHAGGHQTRARGFQRNRSSRPTITTPTSTRRASPCPSGSNAWRLEARLQRKILTQRTRPAFAKATAGRVLCVKNATSITVSDTDR